MKRDPQSRLLRTVFTVTGIVTLLLGPLPLQAQVAYSPQEVSMLPEYCKYTQAYRDRVPGGNNPARIQQWYTIFGGSTGSGGGGTGIFHHMHHYCWGLTNVNHARLWARSAQERNRNLENSIREFDYMIGHSSPSERMMPEFLTKKGESLLALGRAPLATMEFERAIALKPDYWPPYAAMSDHYKDIGNTKMAREVLERGLSASPDARALTRRLNELSGGKSNAASKSSRKPIVPKEPAQENVPQSDSRAETPQPPAEK